MRSRYSTGLAFTAALGLLTGSSPAGAAPEVTTLTLPEALELAVRQSFAVQRARLQAGEAEEGERIATGGLWPQLDASAGYTRTILAADPFAGSSAGQAFAGTEAIGWLQLNEQLRTDGDPATEPLTYAEYQQRSAAGYEAAGVAVDENANAFLVENGFTAGLSLSQMLYDESVFARKGVAEAASASARDAARAQVHQTVRTVSNAFYGALLAAEQVEVSRQSVERARDNVRDAKGRVEAGTQPPFQQLTAEVELANLETTLARAESDAEDAVDGVRLAVGLPPDVKLALRGDLALPADTQVLSAEEAVAEALDRRPDLAQAEDAVRSQVASRRLAAAPLYPRLSLVGDVSINGRVPDDRTTAFVDATPEDPFNVVTNDRDFFDDSFWYPTLSFGVQLTWNLFDGFATYASMKQADLATSRARVSVEETKLSVQIDVEQALRDLATAQRQIQLQSQIRDRAELNYEQIEERVHAGVSTQLDLRQASEQLDASRFNHLQAVHDYLVARTAYLVAIGAPPLPADVADATEN